MLKYEQTNEFDKIYFDVSQLMKLFNNFSDV